MLLGMEIGLGPGDFVLDYILQKNSTLNAPELTFLAQKSKKKFWEEAQPPPHSPPPLAPTAPLAPQSCGALPQHLRHLGCPQTS